MVGNRVQFEHTRLAPGGPKTDDDGLSTVFKVFGIHTFAIEGLDDGRREVPILFGNLRKAASGHQHAKRKNK
jgi:hypothetical protein